MFIICYVIVDFTSAQPTIPRESIPKNIPAHVRKEIELLYSSDPVERAYAAVHLGKIGKQAVPAIPYLQDILEDNTRLKLMRFPSFSAIGQPTSLGTEAAKALWNIDAQILISAFDHQNDIVRIHVLYALEDIGDPQAVDLLIAAINDKDKNIATIAVGALGNLKATRAVEPLIAALEDKSLDKYVNNIRIGVVHALAKIGDSSSIDALISVLYDDKLTSYVVRELGELGDKRAVRPLIDALAVIKDHIYRRWISDALSKLTGVSFGQDYLRWEEWWKQNKGNLSVTKTSSKSVRVSLEKGAM